MLERSDSCGSAEGQINIEALGGWQDLCKRLDGPIRQGVRRTLLSISPEGHQENLDDLVQDVYCRLLEDGGRRLRAFRGQREIELRCYVRLTAQRVVLDHLRARGAQKRGGGAARKRPLPEEHADSGPTPEEWAIIAEARRRFFKNCQEAVSRRNFRRDMAILRLIFLEGWTSKEVAARWSGVLSVSSVDSLVFRVRRKLAERGVSLLPRPVRQRNGGPVERRVDPVH